MNRSTLVTLVLVIALGAAAAWALLDPGAADGPADATHADHDHRHGAEVGHGDETPRGPHGGRWLTDGDFAVEITLFEAGLPAEFRVYAFADGAAVAAESVSLNIELTRLGGQVDRFDFTPAGDYLRGSGPVAEPHSFDVVVRAEHRGRQFRWAYASHEGRTQIPETMAREVGIETEVAGPATIRETLALSGRVQTDPDRLSRVRPRFAGVIESLQRNLGDIVHAGDALATVQSNESLQSYAVKAPIGGLIVLRNAQVGEATGEQPLFVIVDLSEVWVELDVFGRDLARVRPGQAVTVETLDGYRVDGQIDFISPLASHASQSVHARVPLSNPDGRLRPGQFVRGHVVVAEHEAALAVRQSAVQRFRESPVVFTRVGDIYEVRMLEPGRSNRDWVEVLGGLAPGSQYVTKHSYLIKADIEKAGAGHAH
jgi:cobalt-zinc-cadmium efflux system membrane fusion protein